MLIYLRFLEKYMESTTCLINVIIECGGREKERRAMFLARGLSAWLAVHEESG